MKEEFKATMLEATVDYFAKAKEVRPMIAALDKEANMKVMPIAGLEKQQWELLIMAARSMFPAVMFVSESWMVKAKDGKIPDVQPSKHPDRIEMVMVMFYFGTEIEGVLAEIIRPKDGDPFLGPWQNLGGSVGGRLAATPPHWN